MAKKKIDENITDSVATATENAQTQEPNECEGCIAKLSEIEQIKDSMLRCRADYENYKRRNQETAKIERENGLIEAILSFLPALDSVNQALAIMGESDAKVSEGLNLIKKQITSSLTKFNIAEIPALGEIFDPNLHNAIMTEEDKENSGKITAVFQNGYLFNGKVIRYALVKVAE
ncbi:MAG: nucleotide exchange factor GrpE [Firmicutes bacterium]|nr:nucleotide exchange factor GrpE [Bacillota bacterium]